MTDELLVQASTGDENPDHVQDWGHVRGFDRLYENNQVWRVETDGMGGLRYVLEKGLTEKIYGARRGEWRALRDRAISKDEASRVNNPALYAERLERFRQIVEVLSDLGPTSAPEICELLGLEPARVATDLQVLENRYVVERDSAGRWLATGRTLWEDRT